MSWPPTSASGPEAPDCWSRASWTSPGSGELSIAFIHFWRRNHLKTPRLMLKNWSKWWKKMLKSSSILWKSIKIPWKSGDVPYDHHPPRTWFAAIRLPCFRASAWARRTWEALQLEMPISLIRPAWVHEDWRNWWKLVKTEGSKPYPPVVHIKIAGILWMFILLKMYL